MSTDPRALSDAQLLAAIAREGDRRHHGQGIPGPSLTRVAAIRKAIDEHEAAHPEVVAFMQDYEARHRG